MRSARDRAMEIARDMYAAGYSMATFRAMAADEGENGVLIRKAIDVIERGIQADRREAEKARAPS